MQYCRRDRGCPGRQSYPATDGTTHWVGASGPRALCDDDTAALQSALGEYVELLWRLNNELPRSLQQPFEPRMSGTPERALPIRVDVDALMHEMVDTARVWAGIVSRVAGDPMPDAPAVRGPMVPDAGPSTVGRMATNLATSTGILHGRLPALLALPECSIPRDGQWITQDGGDAALVLFDLHHRARKHIGQYRKTTHYPHDPCPGCGVAAITHLDGSDIVKCQSCGEIERWERFDDLRQSAA